MMDFIVQHSWYFYGIGLWFLLLLPEMLLRDQEQKEREPTSKGDE